MFGQDSTGQTNNNASFGTTKGYPPANPPSSLNTLTEYSNNNNAQGQGPGRTTGGLTLDVTPSEKMGVDITQGQGILRFPPVFTGKDDNSDYVDNKSLANKGPVSIKKPVRHGTLHNFDPDANPR